MHKTVDGICAPIRAHELIRDIKRA